MERLTKKPAGSRFPEVYRDMMQEHRVFKDLDAVTELDRPGDFTIEPNDGGWRLTIIDWQMIPVAIPITSDGSPVLADEQDS